MFYNEFLGLPYQRGQKRGAKGGPDPLFLEQDNKCALNKLMPTQGL